MDLISHAEKISAEIIALRRKIHAQPELSLKEQKTSQLVCTELDALGIPYQRFPDHSVVAKLVGGGEASSSKRLAIRADMDALPIEEETGLAYASQVPGVMHACGHDGHTAILLGVAKLLSASRNSLSGCVYLCFQPAEEVQSGSGQILDYLASEGGVDCVIAAHVWPDLPSGTLSVMPGARMAAGDFFTIEVQGKGGHGSRPELSIDPIKPLCDIVLRASALPVNRIKSTEAAVVHIGQIVAGTVGNVFPQTALAHGGIRSFSAESREKLKTFLDEVARNTAAAYGATASVDFVSGTPALFNDPASVDFARSIVEESALFELRDIELILASEDFGFYLEQYPGFMCYIGIRNEEKGSVYGLHHPKFDLDEGVLAKATAFFALFAQAFLGG